MRTADSIFSRQERKAAVWALLMAAVIAVLGVVADRWSRPSLGPDGVAAYAYAPAVGVQDAQPLA